MGKGAGGCNERDPLAIGATSTSTDEATEAVAVTIEEAPEPSLEMQLLDSEPTDEEDGKEGISTKIDIDELKKDPEAWKKHLAALKKKKAIEAEARRKQRDKLLAEVLSEDGEAALKSMNPLALQAKLIPNVNLEDPQLLLKRCVDVRLTVNPVFDAVMHKLGAFRRGSRTYSFIANPDTNQDNFIGLLKAIPTDITYPQEHWKHQKRAKQGGHKGADNAWTIGQTILETPLGKKTSGKLSWGLKANDSFYSHAGRQHAAIILSQQNNELSFKVCTQKAKDTGEVQLYPNAPNLNNMREDSLHKGQRVTIPEALSLIGEARANQIRTVVDPRIENLADKADDSILVRSVPGKPGKAELVVGKNRNIKHAGLEDIPGGWGAKSVIMPAADAVKLLEGEDDQLVDEQVADVLRMENAEVVEIDGMMPHQNEAIALHLATQIGYLNAMDAGLGKTPTSLVAAEKKWEKAEAEGRNYRALVTCEKAQINQWASESSRFFPGAQVFIYTGQNMPKLRKRLAEHDEAKPAYPLLVVCSHGCIAKTLPLLKMYRWNDMFIDEGAFLRGTNTKQSVAMWDLRENIDCAVVLTGTPMDRGLDDIGALISWARNDTSLFAAAKLSDYDVTSKVDLDELRNALGPALFRRDIGIIKDKVPRLKTQVLAYDLHKDEKKLADAARDQLREMLEAAEEAMANQIDQAQSSGELSQEEADEARSYLNSLRGAALGGIMLARQAASDPKALETSESVGAALLEEKDLIQPAIKNGGTKRQNIATYLEERIEKKQPAIVFTEFVPVANALIQELQEKGLRVDTIQGSQSTKSRTAAQEAFQGVPCAYHHRRPGSVEGCEDCQQPDVDVLVLTRAASKGLNLQRASTMVHYDMSWIPSDFIQRTGRARRFGSDHEEIEVSIALSKETIEERVGQVLVPRAMQTLMALDGSRGADVADSSLSGMSKELALNLNSELTEDEENKSIFALAKAMVLSDGKKAKAKKAGKV